MALNIYDTLKPQGDYPAVEAADVRMPDGKRLSDVEIPETITDYVKSVNGIVPDQEGNVTLPVSGGASSWNELTDKPFYEEEARLEILTEQTIEGFANDMGYGVPAQGFNFGEGMDAFTITLGETYTVLWDGESYTAVAQDASAVAEGVLALGNTTSFGGTGNGEPFVIGWSMAGITFLVVNGDESTSHTVGIMQDTVTVKPLDAKYLPMEAIDDRIETYISAALEGDY